LRWSVYRYVRNAWKTTNRTPGIGMRHGSSEAVPLMLKLHEQERAVRGDQTVSRPPRSTPSFVPAYRAWKASMAASRAHRAATMTRCARMGLFSTTKVTSLSIGVESTVDAKCAKRVDG